uniref:Protein kinase domain-containing protein n=1 Tax=Acrobeloides nanus TaxID=290746 RepID=A0A914EQ15_9BILA
MKSIFEFDLVCAFDTFIFSLKQFLPLACVRDVNYSTAELHKKNEDGQWRQLKLNGEFLVELLIPSLLIDVEVNGVTYELEVDKKVATRALAVVVNIIDDLLEDWFPAIGTRFMHTSEGFLLVDRLVACPKCATNCLKSEDTRSISKGKNGPERLHLFSIEDCIFHSRSPDSPLKCPQHEKIQIEEIAPDVTFVDLPNQFIITADNMKRGKLVGRGAFGFVFLGFMKHKNEAYAEVALKVLEPVEQENDVRSSAQAAFEAFRLKWKNDAFENGARAYCIARQELNMLTDIQHPHATCLLGFCPQPITLAVELAPLGALDQILAKYRRSNVRLTLKVVQHTSIQIAKALEYLHTNRIIYRDLKSENVLVWRFPPPHSMTVEVHVKLGDYGISRHGYPSGVCKGYGGTEGFMAPEVIRYNGEREYTEKVDSFSYGMFLYELVSLKQPYDRQEQMKDFILEGGRPFLTDKELLFPSNVLDLIVTCWAESAEERPSSSQLIEITSAPEFIHLLDVALLNTEIHPEISVIGMQEPELEMDSSDPGINYQCLLPRSDNAVELFSFNQFGWIDSKIIRPVKHTKKITALHFIEENIWIGDEGGNIRMVCAATLSDLFIFSVSSLHPSLKIADPTIIDLGSVVGRQIATVVLRFSLVLCSYSGPERPQFLMCIELTEAIHVLTIVHSADDWQIWTGHDQSRLFIHHITSKNRLLYSNSVTHTGEQATVSHVVSNSTGVWSSLEESGKVFLWEKNAVLKKTLNCQKLLPMSESLSSMNVESIKGGHVTAMALTEGFGQQQLVVGTSAGVLVIVQAKEMIPLAVFRPFASEIERILCYPSFIPASLLQRELSQQSISSLTTQQSTEIETLSMKNSSSASPIGVNDIYDAVNRVKEKFSNMIVGQKTPQNMNPRLKEDYFVTIGTEYRSLLERFSQTSVEAEEPIRNRRCAIVWRTDDWIK